MKIKNPVLLLILYIIVFIFPGFFLLNFFDSEQKNYLYVFGLLSDFNINKFYLSLFGCVMPILIYLFFVLTKSASNFRNKEIDLANIKMIYFLLTACLIILNLYFFISFNFSIPVLSVAGFVTNETYALLRSDLSLSYGIFNIGLFFFGFGSFISAVLLMKRSYIYLLISILFCATTLMFNMQKSPSLDFIFLCSIGYLFLKNKSINILVITSLIFATIFSIVVFYNPGFPTDFLLQALSQRIFFGEVADLPLYFSFFKDDPISFLSVFPPYINNFFGFEYASAARIIALNIVDFKNIVSVGNYNTIFLGEAYAVLGKLGIIISPLIIILNFYLLSLLINKAPKNVFTVILISFILFKLTKGIFAGIGPFIFSTNQIFIGIFTFYLFIHTKNLSKITEKIGKNENG